MRAITAALLLAFLPLFACSGDFALCQQKFNDAKVAQPDGLAIPISDARVLISTSETPPPDAEISDPYLGLYVVKTKHPFAFPFILAKENPKKTVAVDATMALPGKIVEPQIGLNRLGRFEHPLNDPSLLTDACCALEGIVTEHGVIEKAYLDHLMQAQGRVVYGDAGIRLDPDRRDAVVESIDPFMGENPFMKGDRIVGFDGIAVKGSATVMERILLAAPGSVHTVDVERGGKRIRCDVTLQERLGGGLKSDTYLERFGFDFDEEMLVRAVSTEASVFGVAPGDRLVQVNTQMVSFGDEVRAAMAEQEERVSLLFERDGFQFFVAIPFQKK